MDQREVLEALGRERRRHPRISRDFVLRYGEVDELPYCGHQAQGRLLDISGGGLRFQAEAAPGLDHQLLFEIEVRGWREKDGEWLHSGDPEDHGLLRVMGRVMWTRARGTAGVEVGVRFIGQVR